MQSVHIYFQRNLSIIALSIPVLLVTLNPYGTLKCQEKTPKVESEYDQLFLGMDKSRSKLRNGHAEITGTASTLYSDSSTKPVVGDYQVKTAFDLDRNQWRFDINRPGAVVDYSKLQKSQNSQNATAPYKDGTVRRRYIINGDRSAFWDADNGLCTISSAIDAKPLAHEFYDVRALGLYIPISMRRRESYDEVMAYWKALGKFNPVLHRNKEYTEVRWISKDTRGSSYRWTMHVVETKGFAPTYQKGEFQEKGKETWRLDHEYTVSWKAVAGNVYVPTAFLFKYIGHSRNASGDRHFIDTIDAKITWKDINKLQNDSLFSYTTFGLPDHIGVAEVTSAGTRYIREPKPDPEKQAQSFREVYTLPEASRWPLYAGISVAVIGLISLAVAVRRQIHRNRESV